MLNRVCAPPPLIPLTSCLTLPCFSSRSLQLYRASKGIVQIQVPSTLLSRCGLRFPAPCQWWTLFINGLSCYFPLPEIWTFWGLLTQGRFDHSIFEFHLTSVLSLVPGSGSAISLKSSSSPYLSLLCVSTAESGAFVPIRVPASQLVVSRRYRPCERLPSRRPVAPSCFFDLPSTFSYLRP